MTSKKYYEHVILARKRLYGQQTVQLSSVFFCVAPAAENMLRLALVSVSVS